METFKHIPNEDQDDASAFYLAGYDPSSVSGLTPEPRQYSPEPALDARLELMEETQELVLERYVPRSHFQPAVKIDKDYRSKWLKIGDAVAFLFLAFGLGMILLYLGAFKVIGAVIYEAMQ